MSKIWEYITSLFGERLPKPMEIDTSLYDNSQNAFTVKIMPAVIGTTNALEAKFVVSFDEVSIDELLEDDEVLISVDDLDPIVEVINVDERAQKYGQAEG